MGSITTPANDTATRDWLGYRCYAKLRMALLQCNGIMGKSLAATVQKLSRVLAIALIAFGVWISGVLDSPAPSIKWVAIALMLHILPAAVLLLGGRIVWIKVAAAWIGVFLFLQAGVTNFVVDPNYKTLTPNLVRQLRVAPEAVVGVSGIQTITTDGKGFRVTKTIDYSSDRTVRIFAIGASTTEQIVLDDNKTWTALLQDQIDPKFNGQVEVINTALSGLRAVHDLATLRAVSHYHPDLAIFLIGVNDWVKQIREQFNPNAYDQNFRFTDTLVGKALIVTWAFIHPDEPAVGLSYFDGSYYMGKSNSLAKPDRRQFAATEVAPEYLETLKAIAAECGKGEYKCLFLTQPSAYAEGADPGLMRHFWMTPPDEPWTISLEAIRNTAELYNKTLIAVACKSAIPVFDLAKDLPPTFATFFDDVHFNESGAREVAERLAAPVLSLLESGRTDTATCSPS